MEDEPEKYQSHFSEYIKRGIEPDNIEGMYKKVHAAIRADPEAKKSKEPPKEHKRYNFFPLLSSGNQFCKHGSDRPNQNRGWLEF